MRLSLSLFAVSLVVIWYGAALRCYAAPRKGAQVRVATESEPTTRLRSGQPAAIVSMGRRGRELRHFNVEVQNVGRVTAREVSVVAELGGGVVYPLKGAKRLTAGQRSIYILGSTVPLFGAALPRVRASCSNCIR